MKKTIYRVFVESSMPESNSTINKDRIWPSFVALYTLSRRKKMKRERVREWRREKRKMSSMQWSVHKEIFVLNHSGISDTVLQIGPFCILKKWVHSRIGQRVRPAVYAITLHNYIRLNWNFLHRIVSSVSRSSSKMRRIRQEMAELSKKLSLLTRHSWAGVQGCF